MHIVREKKATEKLFFSPNFRMSGNTNDEQIEVWNIIYRSFGELFLRNDIRCFYIPKLIITFVIIAYLFYFVIITPFLHYT